MEKSFDTCWFIHILLDEIISVLLHFKAGFVLSWNRTGISAVSCYGPKVLDSYFFYTQFQTGEPDLYKFWKSKLLSRFPES